MKQANYFKKTDQSINQFINSDSADVAIYLKPVFSTCPLFQNFLNARRTLMRK